MSFSQRASAYAWMIRHEYAGCNTCHADPSGGGLLTAYGRALGENELTMQWGKLVGGKKGASHGSSGSHGSPSASESSDSSDDDEDEVKPVAKPTTKPAAAPAGKPATKPTAPAKPDKKATTKKGAKTAKPADDEDEDETPVAKPKKGASSAAEEPKPAPKEEEAEEDSMTPGAGAKFLWGLLPLPDMVLLGGDFRSAYVKMDQNASGQKTTLPFKFYMMQADLQAQVSYGRFRANGNIGYDGTGLADSADITRWKTHNLVSRTHWVGADLGADNEWLLRFGRLNLPWGIRSIEHELWIKSVTQTDINKNQQDGLSLSYNASGVRGELMAIIGNLQSSPDKYRQRGYSFFGEYAPMNRFAVGINSMVTHVADDPTPSLGFQPSWRHAHGAFARYSPHEMLYFSLESAYVYYSTPKSSAGGYIESMQADFEPITGIHLQGTFEMTNMPGVPMTSHFTKPAFNYVGSVAWFFVSHADLRFDLTESSLPPQAAGAGGTSMTTIVAQLHLYL